MIAHPCESACAVEKKEGAPGLRRLADLHCFSWADRLTLGVQIGMTP